VTIHQLQSTLSALDVDKLWTVAIGKHHTEAAGIFHTLVELVSLVRPLRTHLLKRIRGKI